MVLKDLDILQLARKLKEQYHSDNEIDDMIVHMLRKRKTVTVVETLRTCYWNNLKSLKENIISLGKTDLDETSKWCQFTKINIRPEGQEIRINGFNIKYKEYFSVNPKRIMTESDIEQFFRRLFVLWKSILDNDNLNAISIKFPANYEWMLTTYDSIVVHYISKALSGEIRKLVIDIFGIKKGFTLFGSKNLFLINRTMRADSGFDAYEIIDDFSHSRLVAIYIRKNINLKTDLNILKKNIKRRLLEANQLDPEKLVKATL